MGIKVTVQRRALADALRVLNHVAPKRTTIPPLTINL